MQKKARTACKWHSQLDDSIGNTPTTVSWRVWENLCQTTSSPGFCSISRAHFRDRKTLRKRVHHKGPPLHVKTRSNSFHSTLEPNTEVFSKVSRSLAQFTLVNSFSTLLNKRGNVQLLCSNLTRAKRRSASKAVELKDYTRSEHALLHRHFLNVFKALYSSQHKHANMSPCQNMQQTCSRFMPKVCSRQKNNSRFQKRKRGHTKGNQISTISGRVLTPEKKVKNFLWP